MFVREDISSKVIQKEGSDEAGGKEAQGSSPATPVDRSWVWSDFERDHRIQHESEERKQQKAIIQEKLNNAELNVDDEKLELGSPLDQYDGEPILLTTLKELEKEEKDAQKGQ